MGAEPVLLDDRGRVTQLEVTDDHPFKVQGRGWVKSIDLRPGMRVVTMDHRGSKVVHIEDLGHAQPTYNLEVADNHTFFVGQQAVLVHNTMCSLAAKAAHGNKVDERAATLYEKYDKDGNFLKHGITKHENPAKRYTSKQIDGGTVVRTDRGPRSEMIKKERDLVERSPGPHNREPWAGKRLGE
jgi:hypothetical protein